MSVDNRASKPMSDTKRPDTPLTGLRANRPIGACPGCEKDVLENDFHFKTTRSGNVWHAKCAEGILDASGTLVRIVNVYAIANERALLFLNAGRVGQGVKAIEAGTTAVNSLMTDAGVSKMFTVPARPAPYAVPPATTMFDLSDPQQSIEDPDDDD